MSTSHPTSASTGSLSPGRQARLVIVGNGMVSHRLCEKLMEANGAKRFHITVLGEEREPAYDRVHLTQILSGKPLEDLLLDGRDWYEQHQIALHLGDKVTSINREQKRVLTASGASFSYDTLVLATGSAPFVPSMPGSNLPGVFVYRTAEDLTRILAYARYSKRAAVLGGGLLGLEAARALQKLGLQTFVVERGITLLPRQLEPKAAAIFEGSITRLGLRMFTGRATESIEAIGTDRLLQFQTGEGLRVQLVVIAAGVKPRDELAAQCGLKLGRRGGVQVDDALQTSDPSIYAIGECASHRDLCYGLVAPGYKMAGTLAMALMGRKSTFTGAEMPVRLKVDGIDVATYGDFQGEGDTFTWASQDAYRRIVVRQGRLVGATSVGEWNEATRIQEMIERGARVSPRLYQRFEQTGRFWKDESVLHISQWPAAAVVCNCTGVRRGALSAACESGCTTIEQLARKTGASTVCGSCKPLLADMLGAPPETARVPGLRLLGLAVIVAALLACVIALAPPIAFGDSVRSVMHRIDVLWREEFWKQLTGYVVAGLALVSLGLSLRKRIKTVKWGEYGYWRALHAVLGVLSLTALVSHTGFRLGNNLNFILMTNFLALAFVGALAGAVISLERRLAAPVAKRLRSCWTALHIGLAWPLPVLVFFHVLAAYYF